MIALALSLVLATGAARIGPGSVGSVSGRTLSRTGEPLPGVVVTLYGEPGGFSMARVTDAQGAFAFSEVPLGTYRIVASLPRYEDATLDRVLVDG
ncbi:MAG TPA: carboxypeptidase-like regulatory domain-containing protein, partial [Vicinamibacteria bacterium]|nr:carboxypeptidase-like regulatory domain-containing protein [Vicinamibacteria bacterium]